MCLKSELKPKKTETKNIKNNNNEKKIKKLTLKNQEFSRIFLKILVEGFKISKDQNNEYLFIDEGLSLNLLEMLNILKKMISANEKSIILLDILNYSIGILKNNSSNENLRVKLFEKENMDLLSYFFHFFDMSFCNKKEENDNELNNEISESNKM